MSGGKLNNLLIRHIRLTYDDRRRQYKIELISKNVIFNLKTTSSFCWPFIFRNQIYFVFPSAADTFRLRQIEYCL